MQACNELITGSLPPLRSGGNAERSNVMEVQGKKVLITGASRDKRMLSLKHTVLLVLAAMLATACSTESPENLAQQAKNIGVYARMDNSLRELAAFGAEDHNIMTETMNFKFTEPIPKSQSVSYFVVNVPNSNISDSKLFWLPDVMAARWHYFNPNDPRDPKPVKATIEPLSATIYKVSVAEPNAATGKGFLCLWLKMPMGTPDRLYAVQVGA